MNPDCVFCKIVRKEIPAELVYEDDEALAFLDIKPTTRGHTLVIPKKHVENIFDADEATLAAAMRAVKKVAPAVRDAVGAHGLHINTNNGAAAGQIVFHLHFHLIPRIDRNEFEFWPQKDVPQESRAELAQKVRAALS